MTFQRKYKMSNHAKRLARSTISLAVQSSGRTVYISKEVDMPQWCKNTLTITGPDEELKRFFEHGKRKWQAEYSGRLYYAFDFQNFVPLPLDLSYVPIQGEVKRDARYAFCVKNWGCKDSPIDVELNQRFEWGEIQFITPWSPPLPFLEKVSKLYPQLEFELFYKNVEQDFTGIVKFKDGEVFEIEKERKCLGREDNG